ncbi:MAG TPA: hypothetical protein VJL58_04495 [Pyrinomonadaceae bacterium]|nr:hypothetical protein [Pyrinomonadaceae bacterium]
MPTNPTAISGFYNRLPADMNLSGTVEERLLPEYGAVFVTQAVPPPTIVFENEAAVSSFQDTLEIGYANIGGFDLELQKPAMNALLAAAAEASDEGLSISPRGADSARRNYLGTVELWASRVEPALDHWLAAERISAEQAANIRSLSPFGQVPEVFKLEREGIWFAKDLSKSIIYSVAPPGTSQHLSMLAFDVAEFDQPQVREILAKHGWYQTVVSDLPHFTFLGMNEGELSNSGLKQIAHLEREFWIPDI